MGKRQVETVSFYSDTPRINDELLEGIFFKILSIYLSKMFKQIFVFFPKPIKEMS